MSQVDDPLKRTVEDQVRGIVKSQFGDDAEELFDPNIWKSMDRYLSKIGESVRRAKVLNLLEEQGIAFKEPLAWIKGQIDEGYDALKGLYGNRGDAFDEVFRGIEAGFDPEQVKALRMARAGREGASAMGQQTAAWVAEVEIIEAKLVELQIRLAEKMSSVTRGARRSTEALGEFMKPLLQEASVLGYRQAQLKAISAMLAKQGKAVAPTITDQQLLAQLTEAFGAATAEMRVLVQEAKSLAAVDDSVKEMRGLIAALQAPLNQLDPPG